MSEWLDSELIESQVEMIDASQKEVMEAKEKLRAFVLSDDFLLLYRTFELLLSTWVDKLMTLVDAVESGNSFSGGDEPRLLGKGLSDRVESEDLTLMKGVLLCIAILGSVLLVVLAHVPWVVAVVVVFACLVCAFFDKIADFVRGLFSHEEEEKNHVSSDALTASISENLDYIRRTYLSARFLIKHQKSCSQVHVKQHCGVDDALFNRERQLLEDLPHDFIGRIDSVSLSTNSVAFKCKYQLLSLRHRGPEKADASVKRDE